KLVAGRSNRKYADEDAVIEAAKAAGYSDIFKQSLITLTAMERLMGKTKFNEILGAGRSGGTLITKPPGKPTLAPLSDKRPAINTSVKDEFKEEN
ncbi:MAG: DUF2800 domain-containing protein, partial [Clostridiales bacterium]|nr:DUF2800 domain-containing protein [Clostridiales bacterium]